MDNKPLRILKGVGPKKEQQLNLLGITSLQDLIYYLPRGYEDFGPLQEPEPTLLEQKILLKARPIRAGFVQYIRKGLNITKVPCSCKAYDIQVVFYNQPYVSSNLSTEKEYLFYGKLRQKSGGYLLECIRYEEASHAVLLKEGLQSIYPLKANAAVTQKELHRFMLQALEEVSVSETLPEQILQEVDVLPLSDALKKLHIPASKADIAAARRRIAFESFLPMNIAVKARKAAGKQTAFCRIAPGDIRPFLSRLPFDLTSDQAKACKEIASDLNSSCQMNRLLQGDVGSGKTVVAQYALYSCAKAGYQSVLTAPTEILVQQHYKKTKTLLAPLGIRVECLTGTTKNTEAKAILSRLKTGETDVLVGTHRVFSDNVVYHNLGLTIVDEQHRFGVLQRGTLENKGKRPHMLVLSATPIPRTLSMVLYDDLDISVIKNKPAGRKPVKTFAVTPAYMKRILAFARKEIEKGQQVYFVYPAIAADNMPNVEEAYAQIQPCFKGISCACLHSKVDDEKRRQIMERFDAGEIKVLFATSMIEVGIDVKPATLMVIVGAERFGLSQLHQLRGRVGRSNAQSYCILVSGSSSENTAKRLAVLTRTEDGFKISEEDLKLRGPGDLNGTAQSGYSTVLKQIYEESEIFLLAAEWAERMLHSNNKQEAAYVQKVLADKSQSYHNIARN